MVGPTKCFQWKFLSDENLLLKSEHDDDDNMTQHEIFRTRYLNKEIIEYVIPNEKNQNCHDLILNIPVRLLLEKLKNKNL